MRTEERARPLERPPDLEAEREVEFGRLGRTLVSRWWLVLLAVLAGALAGWLLSVGGGDVYSAKTTIYLGNPLGPGGGGAVQGLSTNPATVNQIIHAESTIDRVAAQTGLSADALRGGISSKIVSSGTVAARANQTSQLVEIAVRGRDGDATAKAANALAGLVVKRTSSYVIQKLAALRDQAASQSRELAAIEAQITAFNAALKSSSLTPLEKLTLVTQAGLAEQRRGQVLDQQTQTRQLVQLAQQVEKGQIVTPAAAEKVPARTSTSSIVVGAILGLLAGVALALAWDPLRRRHAAA